MYNSINTKKDNYQVASLCETNVNKLAFATVLMGILSGCSSLNTKENLIQDENIRKTIGQFRIAFKETLTLKEKWEDTNEENMKLWYVSPDWKFSWLIWGWQTETSQKFVWGWQYLINPENRIYWAYEYRNNDLKHTSTKKDYSLNQDTIWVWFEHFEKDWFINEYSFNASYAWIDNQNITNKSGVVDAEMLKFSTTEHIYMWNYGSLYPSLAFTNTKHGNWKEVTEFGGSLQYTHYLGENNGNITLWIWRMWEKETIWASYTVPVWPFVLQAGVNHIVWAGNIAWKDDNIVNMQIVAPWFGWKLPNPSNRFEFWKRGGPVLPNMIDGLTGMNISPVVVNK